MRARNTVGLLSVVLAGAACSSPVTSPAESTAVTSSALASSGPTLDLDLGSSDPTQVVTVSIIFKATPTAQLEQFVQSTQVPGSPSYHRFLSVNEFAARFAPPSSAVARVSAYLAPFGIQTGATLADNLVLKATAPSAPSRRPSRSASTTTSGAPPSSAAPRAPRASRQRSMT